ncbi:site-specific tyrosine recombinase XerD [Caballeronia glebae]|uniref:Site-specific tyrosine recombinase XerD n=1 Tax=Caballeronia glebae TaxID=1777143 RepID=A0A158D1T2_9BURK|nr:site-specific integrase [Caballeronia glebae]SAK88624.1 site-specific tyrosine recombinase XerD [Caballeronia glebae]
MALLHLSSIVSVKLKYVWQKPNTSLLFFRRRIPDDIKPMLAANGSPLAGKVHYVVSLQTSDPRVAAPRIAKLVKQTDEDWARLRSPSRGDIAQQAHEFLVRGGVDPSDPQATPEAVEAFFEFVDHQLPKAVQEDENVTQGRQVDPHLSPVHAAALQMVQGRVKVTLADCLEQYVAARGDTEKDARMVFGYLFAFLGTRSPVPGVDRDLRSVKRPDVNEFVKWLLAGKHRKDFAAVSTTTVSRYLTNVRAAFARAIRENELSVPNVFAQVEIPKAGKDAVKRETFTIDQYRHLHHALDAWTAERGPDQLRCILTLVAETGARLGEIVGLASADAHLRAAVPYLDLKEHPWRSLKTLGSARRVPLTPKALEAAKVALRLADHSPFLFPRYTADGKCRADSASASLVQWVRTREGLNGTKLGNHSLRHGMEDLLRAVGCPDSARDQITGHKTPGMGANYGRGYPLDYLADWLTKAVAPVHA